MTRVPTFCAAIVLVVAWHLVPQVATRSRAAGPSGQGARVPGPPSSDGTPSDAAGTAQVAGRIVAGDTGRPLRWASVSLDDVSGRAGVLRTTSDEDGRYAFTGLPAGRYLLRADLGGYATVEYGQRGALERGRPLRLAEGEALTDVELTLPRGGVIGVRVTDDFGEPLAGALVQAHRFQWGPDGRRAPVSVFTGPRGPGATDDRGEARIFGLMPGRYVVSARTFPAETSTSQGLATGGGNESIDGFVPTFNPGTVSPAEAVEVTVGVGQEVFVQFPMVPARLATVEGTVLDSTGRPAAGANVSLDTGTSSRPGASVGADGRFRVAGVPPGEYTLSVTSSSRGEFALTPIAVSGADLTGLRILTGAGATIRGRVRFSGRTPLTPPELVVMVRLRSADGSPLARMGPPAFLQNGRWSPIDDEGNFEIPGATGRVLFDVTARPGWEMTSVRLDGRDITDEPLEVAAAGTVSGVVIAVTDALTSITGRVADGRGQGLDDYVVVVQPAESLEPVAAASRIRALRPDEQGRFETRGLRPGRYVATALERLEDGRQFDPAFRQEVRGRGDEFELRDGGSVTLDLTLATGL